MKFSNQRHADAMRAARLHQDRNKTDPFAFGRAYNAVWRGILTLRDFEEGNISC